MPDDPSHPTRRFSSRVGDYVLHRPGYPPQVLALLQQEAGLTARAIVADVGSGTGISSRLLLEHGCTVYGVEPNADMRQAAQQALGGFPDFHSVSGSAEATTLPSGSVNFVLAAQAFHWFDRSAAKREFARILKPGGKVILLWNTRRIDATPFLRAYEALLRRFSPDYHRVAHTNIGPAELAAFFSPGGYTERRLANEQSFDFAGLRGRLMSSSYAPLPGRPEHQPMLEELRRIFDAHAEEGMVKFLYDTEVYWGSVG